MANNIVINLRKEIDAFVEEYVRQPGHSLCDVELVKRVLDYEHRLTAAEKCAVK